ncbi:acyltransferase family protein [sulfur-oxidizing endosymbiont of Gigantopelta aegis]|uniref:acyltransferase family protein n=1 Tax=sulfur-oxidizing endosymbiont of Gigantopelta aegis TaxID=2794934 RepID=UPI0031B5E142
MTPPVKHQHFVDWMKALGMFLIVYGHVVGNPLNIFNLISQPVYTKQIGVAFFVFITGWSLANESKKGLRVGNFSISLCI